MTDKEKILVMVKTLEFFGKALRKYPLPVYNDYIPFKDYIKILGSGMDRDPNGDEFITYFLEKAEEELKRKGVL